MVVVGPDGQPVGMVSLPPSDDGGERSVADLVEQPAKVMRIGSMIKQLLEEVRNAPAGRGQPRPAARHPPALHQGARERPRPRAGRRAGAAPLPFEEGATPSDAELRIAQAQLVGWLEGLFHGIQTALFAQQMSARAQFEEMRRACPARRPRHPARPALPGQPSEDDKPGGGLYL